MILCIIAMSSAALCAVATAATHSGKADADWLTATTAYVAGKPVQTAVRLAVDAGWHTYWFNPGEGGMKMSVKWELPEGWTAGELEHPAPKRFMTGELAGFGYQGTVVFPVKFTPPTGFAGIVKLKGNISWLTCNDASCVPGSAELELTLKAGTESPSADAKLIDEALEKIPRQQVGLTLEVIELAKSLTLLVKSEQPFKPADYEIFPATAQTIDPLTKFTFSAEGDRWKAIVPKNEFAPQPIKELALVFTSRNHQTPLLLMWPAGKSH